jgi:hypothetical protein
VNPTGEITDEPAELIAADAQPGKDGKANALLKLLSGVLGVGYDECDSASNNDNGNAD